MAVEPFTIRNCKRCCGSFEPRTVTQKYCSAICAKGNNRRHGYSGTREHATWLDMRNRCRNPDSKDYPRYGGRGITVCERWDSFENFLADMGPKPRGLSIDRRDNSGNYEPSNCHWATRAEQSRNRRSVYTAEQDQQMRDALARGLNFRETSRLIGKSAGSVSTRAYRLGLKSGQRATWDKNADPGR